MCIQRVRGNCHQFVVFFSFTFHFLPSHFGLFFVWFLPFAKLRSIRSERTRRRQTDLFCLILYYRVLFHLFHLLLFDSAVLFTCLQFFRHILHQAFVFDVLVLLIVPRQHRRAGTSIGIYPDHFRGVRGEGSLTMTRWGSPSRSR